MTHVKRATEDSYSQLEVLPSYSGLEATPTERYRNSSPQPHSTLIGHGGSTGSQAPGTYARKEYYAPPTSTIAAAPESKEQPHGTAEVPTHRTHRRRWIIVAVVIGITATAAILGGTLGTLLHKSSHSEG